VHVVASSSTPRPAGGAWWVKEPFTVNDTDGLPEGSLLSWRANSLVMHLSDAQRRV